MDVNITARHFHASDRLKAKIMEDVLHLERFCPNIVSCHVIMSKEKSGRSVEFIFNVLHKRLSVKGNGETLPQALSKAMEKAEHLLKKHREKIKDYGHGGIKHPLLLSLPEWEAES